MNKVPVPAPRLWITDIDTLRTRETPLNFDVIVSVCQDTCWDNVSDDVRTKHYSLAGSKHAVEQWGGSADYHDFAHAASYVLGSLEGGHETLVHCHAGQNRSCAVSIAALAVYHDEDYYWAENLVDRARPMNLTKTMRHHAFSFIEQHGS